ncbi:DNA polymerase II [Thaumasiovibrio subtropicus]|uniref:DNA polymerase II n=1 Tax=Thaumasiovibrio subtropicus TaxID=1891207 RepID=UPI000B35D47C|nr:DNA polymerase II [Thaumasiovibrio subtropicus]
MVQDGFILSRHFRDRGQQTELVFWVKTDQGPAKLVIEGEQPVFFVLQKDLPQVRPLLPEARIESIALKTFDDEPVAACYFSTLSASQAAIQKLELAEIVCFETDIRLADRFLMERFICGGITFTGHPRQQKDFMLVHGAKAKAADYQPTLSVVSLDIECSEKGVLYSVGLDGDGESVVYMVGEPQPDAPDFIEWVPHEKALLQALERWFERVDPDVIIGWNVIDFDMQLLAKRANVHRMSLRIGRGGEALYVRQSPQQQTFVTLPGRVVLDGIDSLKTATYGFRSWSLEAVSQELLGKGKSIDNPYDRMEEINRQFREDKIALATYNLQDCKLVNEIFDHTHLLEFIIQRTRLTGVELDRIGGSVAAFTNLYLPKLHRAGYVAPNLSKDDWIASPGGYVMDSKPGLYESVLVLDFKSLYPSIIRTFKIDPMGLIEGLKQAVGKESHEAIAGFRGGQFHRERHFLPALIEQLWTARDAAKRQGEKAFSQAIKIIMNSFYGVLGSSGCRFFDFRLASSITMRGHEIMKQTSVLIQEQGYEVIYGDTDSIFVALHKTCTQQEADLIGVKLMQDINAWWQAHLADEYQVDSALELEYETHYHRFLMPTIRGQETGSKKRYAGLLGFGEQETLVFKGLETVRTDWTPLAQHFQKQLYSKVFHDEPVREFVREYVDKTRNGELDDQLIYRKRLRRKLVEYTKNVPPHVRAARLADEYNRAHGRQEQYQRGGWIEYRMTTIGPEPLEIAKSPIDYDHYVEKQIKPIADAILPFIGEDFDNLTQPQLGLF